MRVLLTGIVLIGLQLVPGVTLALSDNPLAELGVAPWRHADLVHTTYEPRADYLLGLGPMRKIRGQWQPRESRRVIGVLARATWLVRSGYSAEDGLNSLVAALGAQDDNTVEELFRCQRLKCGSSGEWANRVFGVRELYGSDRNQTFVALSVRTGEIEHVVVIYAVQRSNMRQYLHVDRVTAVPPESGSQ